MNRKQGREMVTDDIKVQLHPEMEFCAAHNSEPSVGDRKTNYCRCSLLLSQLTEECMLHLTKRWQLLLMMSSMTLTAHLEQRIQTAFKFMYQRSYQANMTSSIK